MTPAIGWLIAGLLLVLVFVYDAFLIQKGRESMSKYMVRLAAKRPIVTFGIGLIVGVLAGHFFFALDSCLEAVVKGTL